MKALDGKKRPNWSFFCKASRSGWAASAGSCRLACCPQNVLTAAQFGIHGGCVLNWCGVGTGTHKLRSSNSCVAVRTREAGTRGLTTNRPPLTKSHIRVSPEWGQLFNAQEGST